jgi:hypothetical protein
MSHEGRSRGGAAVCQSAGESVEAAELTVPGPHRRHAKPVEPEAQLQLRVNGHLHLRALRAALERHTAETVGPNRYGPTETAA